ncbi:MAG: DNA polymerase III subunit delta [Candidatus Saccharibacteria bacterium]
MITLIFGENAYERDSQLDKLISQSFDRYDGLEINTNQLSQIILGVSLFNPSNISVIYSLSENKDLWNFLGENLTDDIISRAEIILIDSKIDKRSKTFKLLQKKAKIIECKPLSEKNLSAAKKWLLNFAKSKDIKLLPSAAEEIVEKIGTDQYKLKNELDRLSVMGNITSEVVKKFTPRQLKDMAYDLLELAIKGDETNLRIAIKDTQIISDPYKTFGLLVSQFFNISAIVLEPNHPTNIIAEKLGVNLFVLNKLKSSARSLSIGDLRRIILEFTDADRKMKTSSDDPWVVIQTMLMSICQIKIAQK